VVRSGWEPGDGSAEQEQGGAAGTAGQPDHDVDAEAPEAAGQGLSAHSLASTDGGWGGIPAMPDASRVRGCSQGVDVSEVAGAQETPGDVELADAPTAVQELVAQLLGDGEGSPREPSSSLLEAAVPGVYPEAEVDAAFVDAASGDWFTSAAVWRCGIAPASSELASPSLAPSVSGDADTPASPHAGAADAAAGVYKGSLQRSVEGLCAATCEDSPEVSSGRANGRASRSTREARQLLHSSGSAAVGGAAAEIDDAPGRARPARDGAAGVRVTAELGPAASKALEHLCCTEEAETAKRGSGQCSLAAGRAKRVPGGAPLDVSRQHH
jgi:hypothetical protein